MFTSLLKNMIKDTDEQSDEEIRRASLGVPKCRSFYPPGLGASHSPSMRLFTSLKALWNPYHWDFMALPHIGMINY